MSAAGTAGGAVATTGIFSTITTEEQADAHPHPLHGESNGSTSGHRQQHPGA